MGSNSTKYAKIAHQSTKCADKLLKVQCEQNSICIHTFSADHTPIDGFFKELFHFTNQWLMLGCC